MKTLAKKLIPPDIWTRLCGLRWSIHRGYERWSEAARVVGPVTASLLMFHALNMHSRFPTRGVRSVRLKGYSYPIYFRAGTSDLEVIRQVFVEKQYECVGSENDVKTIVDCGANIGCTSFYFLHRYPNARIIAVEPDSLNFAFCLRNLRPFGERVILVNSGIWSAPIPLRLRSGKIRQWARMGNSSEAHRDRGNARFNGHHPRRTP